MRLSGNEDELIVVEHSQFSNILWWGIRTKKEKRIPIGNTWNYDIRHQANLSPCSHTSFVISHKILFQSSNYPKEKVILIANRVKGCEMLSYHPFFIWNLQLFAFPGELLFNYFTIHKFVLLLNFFDRKHIFISGLKWTNENA